MSGKPVVPEEQVGPAIDWDKPQEAPAEEAQSQE